MPEYVVWGTYCEDVLEKRTPHRQAHLDGLAKQKESGVLITIGPTKDVTKFLEFTKPKTKPLCAS